MFFNISLANQIGHETGLELPRYVSLKSNEANIRVGPSKNYPIHIKFITSDLPLKLIDEYSDWRKVEDFQKNSGWIHKSLIKGERNGIIMTLQKNNAKIYNTKNGKVIGEIQSGIIVKLYKCAIEWCLIGKDNYKGWVNKKNIWGIKQNEVFNIGFLDVFIEYYYNSINVLERYLK